MTAVDTCISVLFNFTKREGLGHKTSLILTLLIEVSVPSQEVDSGVYFAEETRLPGENH